MIGNVVSHYKILEKLGEGGMGVVYKAHDTELDRDVALKFLPLHVTVNEAEHARFLQEARAAAVLNHPNICTVHAIEKVDDQRFIVMEYVEGKTLREIVPVKKMQEAITYAIQIAEALQEAHTNGIVHRDIKAENIMINSKNQIKVMDFGLAKLKGSLKLTKTSSTIGTLAYMAPEQIQGGEVDARSDIFSFGIVLYEMLTGHLPFRGEHEAAMVYSIVNEEPEPIQQYLQDVPSDLVHILNRALDKDPEDRYQSAHDMVIDLRRLKKQSTRLVRRDATLLTPHQAETAPDVVPRGHRRLWIALGALVVVIAAIMTVVFLPGGQQLNPEMKFRVIQTPMRNIWYGDLSVDGNWLTFSASDEGGKFDIYMMNVAGGQPRRVTTDSSAYINGVSLSPDGSTILFASMNIQTRSFRIMSVPSVGGVSREIVEVGAGPGWRPDGQRIAYVVTKRLPNSRTTYELWTSTPDGSDRRCEISDTLLYRPGLRFSFSFSPDWKSVAWTRNYTEGYSEIVVHDMETGQEHQLTNDKKIADDALWLPTGHIVLSSTRGGNANLWVVPASGGEPVQLTKGSGPDAPIGFSRALNRLVYVEMQQAGQIIVANLETRAMQQLTVEDRVRGFPSISETGRFVVYPEQDADALSMTSNLYIVDRQKGTTRKLTDDSESRNNPAVSPDGLWVLDCTRLATEPAESIRVFLLSVSSPGRRKFIGMGRLAQWLSEKEFLIWYPLAFRGSIERDGCERSGPDSVAIVPVKGGSYLLSCDMRAKSRGLWITSVPRGSPQKTSIPRQLLNSPPFWMSFALDANECFYQLGMRSEIRRMSLPGGKDIPLGLKLPGIAVGFGVRPDGKEIVFQDVSVKSRYVAIENVFK